MSHTARGARPDWRWTCDRILAATDGSAASLAAVGWAARIAEQVPASLEIVYAYGTELESGTPEEADAAALKQLNRWCAGHGASGFDMRCTARPGDPRSVLRDAIGHLSPDLVVVGTRGGGGFPGLLVGSIAEWMAQIASYPLAVVPETGRRRSGGPVLVGLDGSEHSELALRWAVGFAGRLRCAVECLHASLLVTSGERRCELDAVRRQVERARPDAKALHVPVDLRIQGQNPVEALATRARNDDVEAIVVGARGHGEFGELTIGRVPRQLLHASPRPVIIVAG